MALSKSILKRLAVQSTASSARSIAEKLGAGSGLITTRERFRLAALAGKAAAEWDFVSFPAAPAERLRDRAVGFADGFAAAMRLLIEAGVIAENPERETKP